MASGVCGHCNAIVKTSEKVAIREGFSYHQRCHKCYVCSETNLQNAEVFKGVIFCASCSKRIFQGCSTVRRSKKPREKGSKSHRRRSHRTRGRRGFRDGILELSTLNASSTSKDSAKPAATEQCKSTGLSTDKTFPDKTDISIVIHKDLKKDSVEIGMTTEVTQQLLQEMQCPVTEEKKPTPLKKPRQKKREYKKKSISDLRIAELGASTEIANMALKNKSEMPVIINQSEFKKSISMSGLHRISDDTECTDEWMDSAYSSLGDSVRTRWMDRRLGSILKIPYASFKKNILTRSSLISDLTGEKDEATILSKIKLLFYEDITEHQRRGLKRLYSTINRKKVPNKLGWLHLVSNANVNNRRIIISSSQAMRKSFHRHKKCCHFRTSHSYRCMRKQVMRLAGPTSSELACFRGRLKSMISPKVLWNFSNLNRKYMLTQGCGPSQQSSIKN